MFPDALNQTDLYEYYHFAFASRIVQIQIDEKIHLSLSMIHRKWWNVSACYVGGAAQCLLEKRI